MKELSAIFLTVFLTGGTALLLLHWFEERWRHKFPEILKQIKVKWSDGPVWYWYYLYNRNYICYSKIDNSFWFYDHDHGIEISISINQVLEKINKDKKIRQKFLFFL